MINRGDESCDVGEYLDYENCKCRNKLVDKLAEECSENIDGNKMIYNGTVNDYRNVCNSCTIYIILLVIFLIISISISSVFIHFHWYLKKAILNAIPLKQQFIECNSIKHINGKY